MPAWRSRLARGPTGERDVALIALEGPLTEEVVAAATAAGYRVLVPASLAEAQADLEAHGARIGIAILGSSPGWATSLRSHLVSSCPDAAVLAFIV